MKLILAFISVVLLCAAVVCFFQYITEEDEYEKRKIKAKGITYIILFSVSMSINNVVVL